MKIEQILHGIVTVSLTPEDCADLAQTCYCAAREAIGTPQMEHQEHMAEIFGSLFTAFAAAACTQRYVAYSLDQELTHDINRIVHRDV